MERCPNCGASIRAGARFCTACGFRLEPAVTSSPVERTSPPTDSGDAGRTLMTADAPTTVAPDDLVDGSVHDSHGGGSLGGAPADDAGSGARAAVAGAALGGTAAGSVPDRDLAGWGGSEADTGPDVSDDHDAESSATTDDDSLRQNVSPGSAPHSENAGHGAETAVDDLDESVLGTDDAALADRGEVADGALTSDSRGVVDGWPAPSVSSPPSESGGDASGASPGTEAGAVRESSDDWWTTLGEGEERAGSDNRDDVVIGSTVVGESSWPTERADPSKPVRFTPVLATDAAAGEAGGASAPAAMDVEAPVDAPSDQSPSGAGRDSEYEPWGTGTEVTGAPSDHGQLAYFPGVAQSAGPQSGDRQPLAPDGAEDPLQRARRLLEELQQTVDSLMSPPEPSGTEPASSGPADALAEASQLVEAFGEPAVDDQRLTELQRLSSDLEGRDYDIRALQRFAREGDLILELVTGYRQQQDLIAQLREVLSGTPRER